MSDTNVGMGMVPCRKGCRCMDCQLEAKDVEIARLEGALRELHTEIIPNWSKREAYMFIEQALGVDSDE